MAARDFLSRHETQLVDAGQCEKHSDSAYEALHTLAAFPGLSPDLKQAVVNLTMRVTEEFVLPVEVDLIDEASRLIAGLQ